MNTVMSAAAKAAIITGCDLQNFTIPDIKFNTTFFIAFAAAKMQLHLQLLRSANPPHDT